MKRKNAVLVYAKPQTPEEIEFNLDGITFLNTLEGMSYEAGREQAVKDMKEMEVSNGSKNNDATRSDKRTER